MRAKAQAAAKKKAGLALNFDADSESQTIIGLQARPYSKERK